MSQTTVRAVPNFMSKWVPFAIAVTSFIVSMYTFFITQREPIVDVVLPQQIRISVNTSNGVPFSIAFLRPTFVNAGPSQQVEVVETMHIILTPPGTSTRHRIEWRETGAFVQDPTSPAINYLWHADPAPLLLSRETAQSPLAVFYGDTNLIWAPGEWRAELHGTRMAGDPDLVARFTFTITQELFDLLNTGAGRHISIPIVRTQ
jgi:hypothetical protein